MCLNLELLDIKNSNKTNKIEKKFEWVEKFV